MGVEVTDGLSKVEDAKDSEILRNFEIVPKLFSGRQITIVFSMTNTYLAPTEDCEALRLEIGATTRCSIAMDNFNGRSAYADGEREVALALLNIPKNYTVRARANTAFGSYKEVRWGADEPLIVTDTQKGLIIKEILSVEPPTS